MSDRARDLLERCLDVLQFYADPKTYEVMHSTDRDVCDSTHCGCSTCPVSIDEGAMAEESLDDVRAYLREPATETPKDDDPCPSCCGSGCRCACHVVGWRRPTLSP